MQNAQGKILREVYPEWQGEILRCAQNDSIDAFSRNLWSRTSMLFT